MGRAWGGARKAACAPTTTPRSFPAVRVLHARPDALHPARDSLPPANVLLVGGLVDAGGGGEVFGRVFEERCQRDIAHTLLGTLPSSTTLPQASSRPASCPPCATPWLS